MTVDDDDVAVCFYGDLFRRMPGTAKEDRLAASRVGIAESMKDLAGTDAIAALGQAASDAAFERTVDMVAVMTTDPDMLPRMRGAGRGRHRRRHPRARRAFARHVPLVRRVGATIRSGTSIPS